MFGAILDLFKKLFFFSPIHNWIYSQPILAGVYLVHQIQGWVCFFLNLSFKFEHPISLWSIFYPTELVKNVLFESMYFSKGVEEGVSKLLHEMNTNSIEIAFEEIHKRNLHKTEVQDATIYQRFLCLFSTPLSHPDTLVMFFLDLFLLEVPSRINQFYYGVAYWDSSIPTSPFSLSRLAPIVKKYSLDHKPKPLVYKGYEGAYPGLMLIAFLALLCAVLMYFKYYRR